MKVERQQFHARTIRGFALDVAAQLEAHCRHFLLNQLYAGDLARQTFFAVAAEIDLDRPELFLSRVEHHAPTVFMESRHLDALAQIARALIVLKPRKTLEVLFGSCPVGLIGLFSRVGGDPLYGKEAYRTAFELYSKPEHRKRAKALGQLQGFVRPEHILMASELDDILVHRAVLERAKPHEVTALNAFVRMLATLCDATAADIRETLDQLPANVQGVKIGEWTQSWLKRQVRLPVPVPIPDDDPALKVRLGADQIALGRRFRNCASSLMSSTFTGEQVLVEWTRPGQEAVIELALVRSGSDYRWQCEGLLRPRNRRVSPAVAAAIRQRFDELGILYRFNPLPSDEQQGIHALLDHFPNATFVDRPAVPDDDDEHVERLLDGLEMELHGEEAA